VDFFHINTVGKSWVAPGEDSFSHEGTMDFLNEAKAAFF
jgi:hypothetical protein